MEFWGVEVKNGESLKVTPGENVILHLSQACMGLKQEKQSEPVSLFVKFGDQKLGLGTLSSEKFPQISFDLVFEKEFELSHNWKNGSVFFTGYRAQNLNDEEVTDSSDFDDDDIPVSAANGRDDFVCGSIIMKQLFWAPAFLCIIFYALYAGKPGSQTKKAVKLDATEAVLMGKIDEEDSSESDEDSGEDELMVNGGEAESSEGEDDSVDSDDDESEDEETPKKDEARIKRPAESSKKTSAPEKKAKLVTPQKNDGKKGVHIATPHPSKQAGKAAATNTGQAKQQTPKSVGDYSCKSCNRSFKTEDALQSHNRAKHI